MKTLLLVVLCTVLFVTVPAEIIHSRKKINERLEIVLVHGGEEAKMNHVTAFQYCKNLTTVLKINTTRNSNVLTDLLSIHDEDLIINEILPFVLANIDEMFWIGGYGVWNKAYHGPVLRIWWTDHSLVTFKNFHAHLKVPHPIRPDNRQCTMVAYTTGKWALTDCAEKKYFVCEIVNMRVPIDFPSKEKKLNDADLLKP